MLSKNVANGNLYNRANHLRMQLLYLQDATYSVDDFTTFIHLDGRV